MVPRGKHGLIGELPAQLHTFQPPAHAAPASTNLPQSSRDPVLLSLAQQIFLPSPRCLKIERVDHRFFHSPGCGIIVTLTWDNHNRHGVIGQ